jgi:endonuclease YncB( thermonuclease family)
MRLAIPALVLMLVCPPIAANAETIAGRASVIDGDTIDIHGERIRILDIDAPESRQTCQDQSGANWHCGQKAALALSDWIGRRPVTCESDELDQYKRHLARCTVAGQDLGEWMVDQGWAVPYRDCKCGVVRDAANRAKASKLGIWSGSFTLPWIWRAWGIQAQQGDQPAEQPTVIKPSTSQGADACLIKGNINSKGEHIYHVPGGAWYDKTEIDESKGERWFCSEAEAQAVGWRPAKQ